MAGEDLTGPSVLNVQSNTSLSGKRDAETPSNPWLPRNMGQLAGPAPAGVAGEFSAAETSNVTEILSTVINGPTTRRRMLGLRFITLTPARPTEGRRVQPVCAQTIQHVALFGK